MKRECLRLIGAQEPQIKLLYLDTETTGLSAKKNGLTQLSGIIVIDGIEKEQFDFNINPFTYVKDVILDEKALEITEKTEDIICKYDDAGVVLHKLKKILEKYIDINDEEDTFQVIGYNTSFDTNFMKRLFREYNSQYSAYFSYRDIDILALVRHMQLWGIINTADAKLGTLCAHYNIQLDAHNALNDIIATRELYKHIVQDISDTDFHIVSSARH